MHSFHQQKNILQKGNLLSPPSPLLTPPPPAQKPLAKRNEDILNSALRRSWNTSLALLPTFAFPLYGSYFRSDVRACPASSPWKMCSFLPHIGSPAGHTSSFSLLCKKPGLTKVALNTCSWVNAVFLWSIPGHDMQSWSKDTRTQQNFKGESFLSISQSGCVATNTFWTLTLKNELYGTSAPPW